jgi:hypothetical protein
MDAFLSDNLYHWHMNRLEKHKLKSWLALRNKNRISFIDVLSIQPKLFWVSVACLLAFGLYVFFQLGPHTSAFGVFIGGLASTLGYLIRIRRNIRMDLRYINWVAINEALGEQAHID